MRLSSPFPFTFVTTAIRNVGFHADDRLDALLATGLVKLDGPVHVSMVGESQGFHSLILGEANHIGDGVDPIQQAEVAVDVKMAESISSLGQRTSASG